MHINQQSVKSTNSCISLPIIKLFYSIGAYAFKLPKSFTFLVFWFHGVFTMVGNVTNNNITGKNKLPIIQISVKNYALIVKIILVLLIIAKLMKVDETLPLLKVEYLKGIITITIVNEAFIEVLFSKFYTRFNTRRAYLVHAQILHSLGLNSYEFDPSFSLCEGHITITPLKPSKSSVKSYIYFDPIEAMDAFIKGIFETLGKFSVWGYIPIFEFEFPKEDLPFLKAVCKYLDVKPEISELKGIVKARISEMEKILEKLYVHIQEPMLLPSHKWLHWGTREYFPFLNKLPFSNYQFLYDPNLNLQGCRLFELRMIYLHIHNSNDLANYSKLIEYTIETFEDKEILKSFDKNFWPWILKVDIVCLSWSFNFTVFYNLIDIDFNSPVVFYSIPKLKKSEYALWDFEGQYYNEHHNNMDSAIYGFREIYGENIIKYDPITNLPELVEKNVISSVIKNKSITGKELDKLGQREITFLKNIGKAGQILHLMNIIVNKPNLTYIYERLESQLKEVVSLERTNQQIVEAKLKLIEEKKVTEDLILKNLTKDLTNKNLTGNWSNKYDLSKKILTEVLTKKVNKKVSKKINLFNLVKIMKKSNN